MGNRHILIALHRFEGGGAERQAAYLAAGLLHQGYAISILAFGKKEGLAIAWFNAINIDPLITGFSERILLDFSVNIKSWWLRKKYSTRLIEQIRALKVDVIIPFTYPPNVIYGRLWKKMNVQKCFWNQRDEGRLFFGRQYEINALNRASVIISNSLTGKRFLEKYTGREVVIVHNGIKPAPLSVADAQNELRVVMIANIHKYKDHLTMLKAWKKVAGSMNNVKLLLAGKEGDTAAVVRQYVDDNRLADSVLFLGQVHDVPALLKDVHVCAFSSIREGVPNGILECMSAGLPVVATRIDGSIEALGADYAFLSEPNNELDLSDKLISLLKNPALRLKTGAENRERVQQMFSVERMVEKYINLIESE